MGRAFSREPSVGSVLRAAGVRLSIELPEGPHRLRLERPGYRSVERAVKVVRGQSTTVVVELTP